MMWAELLETGTTDFWRCKTSTERQAKQAKQAFMIFDCV